MNPRVGKEQKEGSLTSNTTVEKKAEPSLDKFKSTQTSSNLFSKTEEDAILRNFDYGPYSFV